MTVLSSLLLHCHTSLPIMLLLRSSFLCAVLLIASSYGIGSLPLSLQGFLLTSEMEEGKEDLPNNVLPSDITMDILSKLPTKSLLKFRCVCKSWKTLFIHNPLFVNMHLNRSNKENNKLIVRDGIELYSLEYKEESDDRDWLAATQLHQLNYWIKIVGSCNGLICTMAQGYYSNNNNVYVYPLYIWNPSTRDYKQVPYSSSNYSDNWEYGFGYSRKVNDYKIIKVRSVVRYDYSEVEVYVYSLRYDSWGKLPSIPYIILDCKSGELVNDCLHWRAINQKKWNQRNFDHPLVIAFDIGDETFHEVPLSPDISTAYNCKIQVTTFEMQLCMINIDDREDAKVWVMKEYGVKESWTMLFNIHQPGIQKLGLNLLGLTKKGSVLLKITGNTFSTSKNIIRNRKNVICYDPKTTRQYKLKIKGLRSLKKEINDLMGWTEARTYIESTVGVSINNWH